MAIYLPVPFSFTYLSIYILLYFSPFFFFILFLFLTHSLPISLFLAFSISFSRGRSRKSDFFKGGGHSLFSPLFCFFPNLKKILKEVRLKLDFQYIHEHSMVFSNTVVCSVWAFSNKIISSRLKFFDWSIDMLIV